MRPSRPIPRMVPAGFLASLLAAITVAAPAAAQDVEFPVTIEGPSSAREDVVLIFSAVLPDRPVKVDGQGLSPSVASNTGGSIPMPYEPPMTLVWDWGDGSPPAEVDEYTSASHVYDDEGDYTVTLTVRDDRGTHATDTHPVTITNRDPRITRSAAVEVDPSTQTVEFTASAIDARDDELTYRWDFGDGGTDEGLDLWRVQHRYVDPGRYEAIVVFADEDGGEAADTVDVVVTGTPVVADEDENPAEPEAAPEAVVNGFDAEMSQGVSGTFQGNMRSFAGLHLSQISDGTCRFVFTTWDDALLGFGMAIIDLDGIPEGGARYTIRGNWLSLILEDDAEAYAAQRDRGATGMLNQQGLGGLVRALTGGIADLLPGAERARLPDVVGVDPENPERDEEPRPMPAASPFGLDERQGFRTQSGTLDLTFVPGERATGTYDIVLENTKDEPPPGLETIRMEGTFALDLRAARREGFLRYDGCGPRELEVTAHHPDPDEQHFYTLKPPVRVRFDRPVNPGSLVDDNVEIVYPSMPDGELVRVGVRMLRDPQTVWLIPREDLQPGARYTVRVKTGEEGVRGRDGATMPDADGTGWWSFDFETLVDVVQEGGAEQALACNLFQTARDAPLIRGKPAVARVAALWEPPEGVHPSAHVTDFEGRVILYSQGREVSSSAHRFVRPDLWDARGVDRSRAEHTAQVYGFRPDPDADTNYTVGVEVPTADGDRAVRYRARCPTHYWDYAPIITIDYVAFDVGEWKANPAELEAVLPVLREIAAEAEAYAKQLFPVAEIRGGDIRVVAERRGRVYDVGCGAGCFGPDVKEQLKSESGADIVVGFVPHDLRPADQRDDTWMGLGGGNTSGEIGEGQGVVVSLAGRSRAYFPRYVEALVHEWGHVLELEHIPPVDEAERTRASALREGDAPILYRGIEGFRLTPAGDAGWNKSSVEGNEEGAWLTPLMFPATIPAPDAFIANHHYRQIQGTFERLGWSRNAGG